MPHPLLYSFRRCPYAMRARWALLVSGLLVNLREVALKNKPPELLQASSKGTVPVLIDTDGAVIDESIEIMCWALKQADPLDGLRSGKATEQQEIKQLIDQNDGPFKYHLDRFKYACRFQGEAAEKHRNMAKEILLEWNIRLAKQVSNDSHGWLVGQSQSLADWAIWPFVRQYRLADPSSFDLDQDLQAIKRWLEAFLKHPLFVRLMTPAQPWQKEDPPKNFPADASLVNTNQSLFHLALIEDWEEGCKQGIYQYSTRRLNLKNIGFIHLCYQQQLESTYNQFYSDIGPVLSLKLNPEELTMPLRAEPSSEGELFPHLFGALPLRAVELVETYP